MPMPHPFRHRHEPDDGRPLRRLIRAGMEYRSDQDDEVELELVVAFPEPPVEVQGEPWGWTKPGPRPRGWRKDGRYDAD